MGVYLWVDMPFVPITTPGIYHNASLGLISLSSDGTNWLTIADKNLGATTVWNSGDYLSDFNAGNYYQWGNNYGFTYSGNPTTSSTSVNASDYGPGNYYSNSNFNISGAYWDSSYNANLWGGTTGTMEAMKGPCDVGFHIPTNTEWATLVQTGVTLGSRTRYGGTAFSQYMKLPLSGFRNYTSGNRRNLETDGRYTTSIQYDYRHCYYIIFSSSSISTNIWEYKTMGFSIRPFKNVAEQPTDEWTVLYQ